MPAFWFLPSLCVILKKTRWKPRTRMYSRSWTTSANLCKRKTNLFLHASCAHIVAANAPEQQFTKRQLTSTTRSPPPATLHALPTAHSTLHILHFTLYTLHSTFYTLHSTLDTFHSNLQTLHFTLHTPHCTLCTLHPSLHT